MRDLKVLSANDFRRRLAGIVAPAKQADDKEDAKDLAARLVSILPEVYSADLDRLKMWDRIGNGLASSAKKCGGDVEVFASLTLDFIKASHGAVASNENLSEWLDDVLSRTHDFKAALLSSFETRLNVILVFGRKEWNERKGC
jgi:hypothetical protein